MLIADTNIFLAVVLNEPEREHLLKMTDGQELAAPTTLLPELANALTAMLKRSRLNRNQALTAWKSCQSIPVQLREINYGSSLQLASELNLYAYDAFVLDCSIGTGAPLLTLDRRLRQAAVEIGIKVLE